MTHERLGQKLLASDLGMLIKDASASQKPHPVSAHLGLFIFTLRGALVRGATPAFLRAFAFTAALNLGAARTEETSALPSSFASSALRLLMRAVTTFTRASSAGFLILAPLISIYTLAPRSRMASLILAFVDSILYCLLPSSVHSSAFFCMTVALSFITPRPFSNSFCSSFLIFSQTILSR